MKMKFETCYKLKIGVNNVDIFVDKNILRYRFLWITFIHMGEPMWTSSLHKFAFRTCYGGFWSFI